MRSVTTIPKRKATTARELRSRRGTPTWEIAHFFPDQGEWSESEYLDLADYRRIEFVDGCLDFLPMPTKTHQRLLQFLFRLLEDLVVAQDLGQVFTSGYRVRVRRVAAPFAARSCGKSSWPVRMPPPPSPKSTRH
jgi:Uma2 family endonuclease